MKIEQSVRSRYIPDEVRERVLDKAGYQCEFIGATGIRCTQKIGLEIDHIVPFGKGGSSDEVNLRCTCKAHNLLYAEEQYGKAFIQSKMSLAESSNFRE